MATEKVRGPYYVPARDTWRVIIESNGNARTKQFPTEEQARCYAAELRLRVDSPKISDLADAYELHQRRKGLRSRVISNSRARIGYLLHDVDALVDLDKARLDQCIQRRQKTVSVDTVASDLRAVKTFTRWLIENGLQVDKQLLSIKVLGRRKHGKPQLRVDESRKYLAAALKAPSEATIAAAMPLVMGLRSREVLERKVRDLDDSGRILVIENAKTEAGNRRVSTGCLREYLLDLVADKQLGDLIFPSTVDRPHDPNWLRKQVQKVCTWAQVPTVCTHGLRGTHATIAESVGVAPREVAKSLGHTSPEITGTCYTAPGVRDSVAQAEAERVLYFSGNSLYSFTSTETKNSMNTRGV